MKVDFKRKSLFPTLSLCLLLTFCSEPSQDETNETGMNYDIPTAEAALEWLYFLNPDFEITFEQRRYIRSSIRLGHRKELEFENCPPSDSAVDALIIAMELFDDSAMESLPFVNFFLSECECYPEAFAMKARILFNLDEYYSSKENYDKAIHLFPKNGRYFLDRGICYLKMGNEVLAQSDFNQAATLGDSLAIELYGGIPFKIGQRIMD